MGILGCLTFLIAIIAALIGVAFVNKEKLFQPAVEFAFDSYEYGVLCVEYQDGTLKYFGKNKPKSMNPNQKVLKPSICDASIKINDDKEFFRILATGGGSIGLGEAYIEGVWQTRDKYKYTPDDTTPLSKFVYHLLFNVWAQKQSPLTLRYWAQWGMTIGQFREWIVRVFETNKSEKEDLRDIEYHYDIGNDFFEGYLGPTLSGSCAIWTGGKEQTLEQAQDNKWSTIIKKIGIQKQHHVLDVGCGWGYFCNKIVEDTGAKCTGITLSVEQIKFAKEKWKKNLCKKELDPNEKGCVEFIFKDYRRADELYGMEKFDRVSSTGMIEHVGYVRIEEYFESLYRVTKPEAKMLIHGITMPDLYWEYRPTQRSTACQQSNYISKHIFPGGCIQHVDWWNDAALKYGFELLHSEHYGKHYARTLKVWYDNLLRNWEEPPLKLKNVKGYDDKLLRKHEFYLTMCEAAFRTTRVELTQLVYYKPKYNYRDTTKYTTNFYWINNITNVNQNKEANIDI